MNSIQEGAALIFTAVTVQIGIALVILRASWRDLRRILGTIEPSQRLAAFKSKENENARSLCLALGILFLLITIGLGLISLIGITAPMLGFDWGPYQDSNFEWSRYFTAICTLTFVVGVFLVGFAYLIEALRFMGGKGSVLSNEGSPRKKRNENQGSDSI